MSYFHDQILRRKIKITQATIVQMVWDWIRVLVQLEQIMLLERILAILTLLDELLNIILLAELIDALLESF